MRRLLVGLTILAATGCGEKQPPQQDSQTDATTDATSDTSDAVEYSEQSVEAKNGDVLRRRLRPSTSCNDDDTDLYDDELVAAEEHTDKVESHPDPNTCHYTLGCDLALPTDDWCSLQCANYEPETQNGGQWRITQLRDDRWVVYFQCGDLDACLDHSDNCEQ